MSDKELINKIKSTQKSPMTFDDYSDFFIFIFPIAFIGIGATILYSFIRIEKDFKALIIGLVFKSL